MEEKKAPCSRVSPALDDDGGGKRAMAEMKEAKAGRTTGDLVLEEEHRGEICRGAGRCGEKGREGFCFGN
ncbi:unnamed protein product [Linum trigynum]|uniref:Uncharacterized protein n=1 Tax=Linum trigynum TaxID=586398 RepID=A0AAV2CVK5_9ROSI